MAAHTVHQSDNSDDSDPAVVPVAESAALLMLRLVFHLRHTCLAWTYCPTYNNAAISTT